MISKQYIKDLDFNTIYDIFEYINESEYNGNYTQLKELVNKLSRTQLKEFLECSIYSQELKFKVIRCRLEV